MSTMLSSAYMSVSALATAAAATIVFSPSRQGVVKQVAPSRFRYEPYSARVLPVTNQTLTPVQQFLTAALSAPIEFTPYPSAAHVSQVQLQAKQAAAMMDAPAPAAVQVAPAASTPMPVATAPIKHVAVVAATRYAIVHFKHESATFVAPFKIAAGDLVVVEGDRGENIGVVAEITKQMPSYEVPNKILRRATEQDRKALSVQRERESAAISATRALAESIGLHGRIEDAEYQFDMNKLTIFVRRPSKGTFIDFRKLQRGLFREFRCRIWCAYMDEVEASEAAPRCR